MVDASHPNFEAHINTVHEVLKEIGADDKPAMLIFNKVDRLEPGTAERLLEAYPGSVTISAQSEAGFPELLSELGRHLRPIRRMVEVQIPHEESAVIARLHATGQVLESDYEGDQACFKALIPPYMRDEFSSYIVCEPEMV